MCRKMQRYKALKKIMELGSFSKAAENLNYTQSAISQMISSLENELSVKLLIRSRVGVKLTLEGEKIYPYIEKIIYQQEMLEEKTKEIRQLETGIVRIGTITSISVHWLPKILKEFKKMYPKIEFVIHQGDYALIQEWIKIGAIDFGFLSPYAANGIETLTIKDGNMLAILPKNHKLAKNKVIKLEQLVKEDFILLEEGHYQESLEAFKEIGVFPNIKYTLHDDYAIMAMVEAELGVSILAELMLRRNNYKIVKKKTDPLIKRIISIGYKNEENLSIASKKFIKFLLEKKEELI